MLKTTKRKEFLNKYRTVLNHPLVKGYSFSRPEIFNTSEYDKLAFDIMYMAIIEDASVNEIMDKFGLKMSDVMCLVQDTKDAYGLYKSGKSITEISEMCGISEYLTFWNIVLKNIREIENMKKDFANFLGG